MLAPEVLSIEQVAGDRRPARVSASVACAIARVATTSSAIAFSTACAASTPQVNGPCERDEHGRHLERVEPGASSVSTITSPVRAS